MKKMLLFFCCVEAIASDIHICYVLDDGFSMPTQTSLNSLLQNADPTDDLNIHIVDFGISDENKKKFESLKSVRDFKLDFSKFDTGRFDNLKEYNCGKSIYCRFFFQDIFPNLDKLIFLDGDTIISRSLGNLWKTDLGENYWGGIDHGGFLAFNHKTTHCAAVMLLNLKKFRNDGLGEKLMADALENQKTKTYTEELALHSVCKEKIMTIPVRYNIHIGNIPPRPIPGKKIPPSALMLFSEMNEAVVWHYSGKMKPWNTPKADFIKRFPEFLWNTWWKYKLAD